MKKSVSALPAALAVLSLANGGKLCYNTVRGEAGARTKVKQYIGAVLCAALLTRKL